MANSQSYLISSYTIDIESDNDGGVNATTATIQLFDADRNHVGYVWFKKDGASFPGNWFPGNGTLLITYPNSWFSRIVHLLQTEKPIYASVNIADGYFIGAAHLGTAALEPVGQEQFGEPALPPIPELPVNPN